MLSGCAMQDGWPELAWDKPPGEWRTVEVLQRDGKIFRFRYQPAGRVIGVDGERHLLGIVRADELMPAQLKAVSERLTTSQWKELAVRLSNGGSTIISSQPPFPFRDIEGNTYFEGIFEFEPVGR
jgi:YD repeat-containing protein